jgi:hypothetical protein
MVNRNFKTLMIQKVEFQLLAYVFLYIRKRFMKTSPNNKSPKKRTPKQTQETLQERVHRHLNDINSKITDEDIRNVRTELELRSEGPVTPPTNKPENRKRRSPKTKKQNNPGSDKDVTPWDILSGD